MTNLIFGILYKLVTYILKDINNRTCYKRPSGYAKDIFVQIMSLRIVNQIMISRFFIWLTITQEVLHVLLPEDDAPFEVFCK